MCLLKASELPGEIVEILAKSSCNLLEINEIQVGESPVNIVCALCGLRNGWFRECLDTGQTQKLSPEIACVTVGIRA